MKSVLRSAKPYWVYLILTDKKEVEVGKDCPKLEDWNRTVELYCSKDMRSFNRIPEADREWMRKYLGRVACQFVCDKIYNFVQAGAGIMFADEELNQLEPQLARDMTCLTDEQISNYLGDKDGYGWHISDLVIYDKPKELSEFKDLKGQTILRPFQSWGYVCSKK